MSALVMVRHAQATVFEEDSDRLSAIGEQQAIALGHFWKARNIRFDEVYSGTLQRHTRTAELAGFPEVTRRPAFNEYDANGILGEGQRAVKNNRDLQKLFDERMPQWIAGTLQSPGLESWQAFHERVVRGFRGIVEADRPSRRIVVFTSAGPIGVAVQTVVGAKEPMAMELNWRIRNCSLTEFIFTRSRISLDTFNATPHLEEVTFR
ncbi:MAG TPA: histidine phosphatase family protein [Bryobacteraceae bacterium]|jgi:broad specificity phosphatase PhoE|nr:histidine phosphatase family protein [Bryobacteraceae bacterium]